MRIKIRPEAGKSPNDGPLCLTRLPDPQSGRCRNDGFHKLKQNIVFERFHEESERSRLERSLAHGCFVSRADEDDLRPR
ncbi:MAG TPA: hypothetical protein VGI85_02150 [Chthoniobacterales bacterium]